MLGPVLYVLYRPIADIPTFNIATTATFAEDTAILTSHNMQLLHNNLQKALDNIQNWLKKRQFKYNENKSTHVTFTMKKETCHPVFLNSCHLPEPDEVKYLGMYLDGSVHGIGI